MSLFEKLVYRVMNGKEQITGPTFIKDFTMENELLVNLSKLFNSITNDTKKSYIERDISLMKYGLQGEQNVYYELKNSFLPFLCLHDIRVEYNGYTAQFDFIVITRKCIYVLETKKLSGDITVNNDGEFIRYIKNSAGKVVRKEGMYSPVSQNERHVNILKELLVKEGKVNRFPILSAVVIANPKTIVNKRFAPKHIKEQIYKYDQVSNLLKKAIEDGKNEHNLLEKYMIEIADYILLQHKPFKMNMVKRYGLSESDFHNQECVATVTEPVTKKSDEQLREALKAYRLKVCREENVKAYFIFNNAEMEALINAKPKDMKALLNVSGFGVKKVEKYGQDIITIMNG
jgi:Nuclease-related domain/HRDC domain